MKVKIEIDCTPQEARAFLGPARRAAAERASGRGDEEADGRQHRMLQPEELMKNWMAFGGAGPGAVHAS